MTLGNPGATYYNGSGNYDSYPVNNPSALSMSSNTDWFFTCGRTTAVSWQVGTLSNGVTTSTAMGGSGNCVLSINSSPYPHELIHWELSRVYVWDSVLPDDAFFGISEVLMDCLAGTSESPLFMIGLVLISCSERRKGRIPNIASILSSRNAADI